MVETSEDPGDDGLYGHCERMNESRREPVDTLNQQVLHNSLVKGFI